MGEDARAYTTTSADRLEARTRITPSRIGHPRGVYGRRSGHSERKTIPAVQDSTGSPRVASAHL